MTINKVFLIGNIGQTPEIRYTNNSKPITSFSLATNNSWKNKSTGTIQKKTEWHRIVLFNKLAEIACNFFKKGNLVYIEGSLQTRKWQDKNGEDKFITEVIVNVNGSIKLLSNNKLNEEELIYNKNDNFNTKIFDKKVNKKYETISNDNEKNNDLDLEDLEENLDLNNNKIINNNKNILSDDDDDYNDDDDIMDHDKNILGDDDNNLENINFDNLNKK